jgi:hypothetical protein
MRRFIAFLGIVLFCCSSFSQEKAISIPELYLKHIPFSHEEKRISIPELFLKDVSFSDSIRKIVIESKCFSNLEKQENEKFYLLMDCKYEECKQNSIEISVLPMPKYKNSYTLFEYGYNKISGFFNISNVTILVSGNFPSKIFTKGPRHSLKIEITPPYYYDVPSWTFVYMKGFYYSLYDVSC